MTVSFEDVSGKGRVETVYKTTKRKKSPAVVILQERLCVAILVRTSMFASDESDGLSRIR
jgi:hypothetical protein